MFLGPLGTEKRHRTYLRYENFEKSRYVGEGAGMCICLDRCSVIVALSEPLQLPLKTETSS